MRIGDPMSLRLSVVLLASVVQSVPVAAWQADEDPANRPTLAEQIRGDWVIYRDTPNGRYMTIKEHLSDHSVVTTYDPNQNAVQSHRSEYRIDESGTVPVFRYKNKVVLIGPNAGEKTESESAYIFRVEGDRFFEVHGMLPGDNGKPSLISWERLRSNPIRKGKA